jgi:hypothetical protein
MANRAYLYSLSNRPSSFEDRPETISGLSEWPYAVPFSFRVLASGDPRLCATLVTDGFEDDPPERRTKLYAISADFDTGHARLTKLCAALRVGATPDLATALDGTEEFLAEHRDRYVLLETIELDIMTEKSEEDLRACVEREVERCRRVGAAIDALPADPAETGAVLRRSTADETGPFHGLVLDDDFDNTRDRRTAYPLGLSWWTEVLYFALSDRAGFAAGR